MIKPFVFKEIKRIRLLMSIIFMHQNFLVEPAQTTFYIAGNMVGL